MSTRTITYLTVAVLVAIGVLLFNQVTNLVSQGSAPSTGRLVFEDIRGIDLYYKGVPYPLNFDQHNDFIYMFNGAIELAVKPDAMKESSSGLNKLVVYFFNKPDATITVAGVIGTDLVFSAPTWLPNGYLKDMTNGELLELLSKSHDP